MFNLAHNSPNLSRDRPRAPDDVVVVVVVEVDESLEMGVVEYKKTDDVVVVVAGGDDGGGGERGCDGMVEPDRNSEGGEFDSIK